MYVYQLVCMGSSLGKSPLVLLHFLIYFKRTMGGKDTSSWRQEVIILLLFRSQSFDNFISNETSSTQSGRNCEELIYKLRNYQEGKCIGRFMAGIYMPIGWRRK